MNKRSYLDSTLFKEASKQAYLDGYMFKESVGLDSIANIISETGSKLPSAAAAVLDKAYPIAMAAPFVLGIGAGALHSDITSPTNIEKGTVDGTPFEEFVQSHVEVKKTKKCELCNAEAEEGKDICKACWVDVALDDCEKGQCNHSECHGEEDYDGYEAGTGAI